MKKDLKIEMEEECITCPKLSLETRHLYANDSIFSTFHECSHIEFCKAVRENWEKYHRKREE